jgi:hypothetical protein
MKKIAVIGFQDNADVEDGLGKLLDKYPDATVYFSLEEITPFVKSILSTVMDKGAKLKAFISASTDTEGELLTEDIIICVNPLKEVMRMLNSDDVLALVWDDGVEAHMVLHSLEDFGMETWDVLDGLNPIEVTFHEEETTDELYEIMVQTLEMFTDTLAAYVTSAVLDVLTETIRNRMEEEDDSKGIDL